MKYIQYLFIATFSILLLTGCTATGSDTSSNSGEEQIVSVENYSVDENGQATPEELTFTSIPERVVAGTQGAAELLAKLGLSDKMVGQAAIFGDYEESVANDLANVPVITQQYPSMEQVVGANPDLVVSRAISFANNDWGHGTTNDLKNLGINSYVLATTVAGAKLDALYTDIENLGKIFRIQDKANQVKAEFQAKEQAITEKMADVDGEKTFAYLSSVDQNNLIVYSAHTETFFNDSLSRLKLKNAFANSTSADIGIEELVHTNPDILFITTYEGGPSVEQTKEYLYNNPALASMKAIQEKQVFVLPFNVFWTNSYVILSGLESLGAQIYPNTFR
jgi:iron complex transport system substrate-binding protein